MANNKLLQSNAERLGIRDSPTIQKADYFLRVLNSKPSSKSISDVAKIILCLDLATSTLGGSFDKETALKLTGLRKGIYQNSLNNVEKILNLDKPLTISELCVQLSCTEAKDTAIAILQSYKEKDVKIKDIVHPQYIAASVYASCKLKGIKVDKSQLRVVSRLKPAQWNELIEEFVKFANSLSLASSRKKDKSKYEELEEALYKRDLQNAEPKIEKKEEVFEDYEVWKTRILREASAEILQRELSD